MSIKQLKDLAKTCKVDISGCIEKQDLLETLQEAQRNEMSQETGSSSFNKHMLKQCQDELIEFYLDEMSKVQLLPWGQDPDDTAEMDAIYVDLELIQQRPSEDTTKFRSNDDLVTLKTRHGQRVNRVLIQGETGSGKSTLAANIAYTWAKRDTKSPLSQFQLVFVIGMHEIENSSRSLVDHIFQQILPEDSKVSKDGLEELIKFHPKDVLIIIDGLDEDSSGMLSNDSSEVTQILHNRKLKQCCVILTTRPHRVTDLKDHQKHFTQVKLVGFSVKNVQLYIHKFFQNNVQKIISLIEKLNCEPHLLDLATIPVLLLMICLLWQDDCTLPESKSMLYKETIKYLWKRHLDKEGQSLSDEDSGDEFQDGLSSLLHSLGEVCIMGILQDSNKVVYKEKDFKQDVFHLGCRVGLITKKKLRSKLNVKNSVTFLHKTFQDFCAAVYLSNLHDTNKSEFDRYLGKLIQEGEISFAERRKYVLEFCCGTNPKTVKTIMKHLLHITNQTISKGGPGIDIPNFGNSREATYLETSIFLCFLFESNLNYQDYLKLVPLLSSYDLGLEIKYEEDIALVQFQLKLLQSEPSNKGHLFTLLKRLHIATNPDTWLTPLLEHTIALEEFVMKISPTYKHNPSYLEPVFHALSSIGSLRSLAIQGTEDFSSFDTTKLLQLLTQKKGNQFERLMLWFAQVDCCTVARFLQLNTAMTCLILLSFKQHAGIQEIIRTMPCLTNLKFLTLAPVPVGSDIMHLEPIVDQLQALRLCAIDDRSYHCNTSQIGLTVLLSFLHKAKKLFDLDLMHNRFSVSAMKLLVACLNEMPKLKTLGLGFTQLTDESAGILGEFLHGTPTSSIHTLYLHDNPGIGLESRAALNAMSPRIKIYWDLSAVEADNDIHKTHWSY
ncbi:uncharacterized protein [Amphiura filiformis]|uniref:uncharacterized protein n=1 Tax=Amphiura filiformis TaxID=82378 RepID=UPI003B20F76C